MARNDTMDMIHGPLIKNLFIFAVPLMFSSMLQMLFNAADTIVVGKFAGENALAAVGATGSLIFLCVGLFNGLGTGANVVVAQSVGSQEEDKISKSVHTTIALALSCGLFLSISGIFLARPLLELVSTPENIIDMSQLYMQIYLFGTIFSLTYNFGAAVLRAVGDTKRPMYFLIISGALNLVLNLLFVIVFKMSVAGVAIATVISQAVSAILVLVSLFRSEGAIKLHFNKIRFDPEMTKSIIQIGVPAGVSACVFSLSNTVIQSSINSFNSSTIVAGNSAGANIENFVYIGMMAFSQATITFTSQNIGAKNYPNIKRIMLATLILDASSALLVGFIAWYFGDFWLSLYTDSAKVIEVGKIRLFWVSFLLIFNGILDIFVNSLRGMGYSSLPTAVMIVGICGVRLLWIWQVFPLYRELKVIYMCFPISWIVTSIFIIIMWVICYRKLMKRAVI